MDLRRLARAGALAVGLLAVTAAPSSAVVGGRDAPSGKYPAVARITYQAFLCTGTLISPDTVLTAGHCSSITGAAVATPAAWPAPLINVKIGGNTASTGETATVAKVIVPPSYLVGSGHDISLLKLSKPATKAPAKVAGSGEGSLWTAGTLETIAGWGATTEGGSTPTTLQEAEVPITTDAYCAGAYSDFDPATMVCAGFPQGGTDTCQGDSGGPMFGHAADGTLRVVGSTSFGEGCARPNKPGVYARVGDTTLREWIRTQDPDGVN
jgi:secreted trypsin-like serine protease